ncbi:glycosyltransferase family 39 protein [Pseudofrankia sp. DC12]|uniref:glycosyltransferase family 39 protein n=1 Tax=Pseudofrankia sp. DC12 TaxID=683315 RepID=UPI001E557AC3|nr:glycosyltransferase family 39 protein [Pseudofrankia sp. DC12]
MDASVESTKEPLPGVAEPGGPEEASRGPDAGTVTPPAPRPPARRHPRAAVDIAVPAALAGAVVAVLAVLHTMLARPLWYDEIWRPHFLSAPPSTYWSQLAQANTPSALGWAVLIRLVGDVAGWHAWALRVPELVALVALPVVTYAFIRRFAGPVAAGLAAASLGLSGVVVDLGTQLKPYSVEALASLVIVWLWVRAPSTAPWHRRLGWRTAAGLVALFSVPAALLVIPLAAVDVVTAGYGYRYGSWRVGWRHRLWAAATAAPAVVICGLHTWLFIGHQSSQRASQFWNTQFLAGRGPLGGLRFVARELVRIFGGAPTGVDRYDPNLVHPATDPTFAAAWLLAPAAAVAFLVGAAALARGSTISRTVWGIGGAHRPSDRPATADDGGYVVAAVLGALVLALAASAGRYWPFGANRTNLFLVPLLVTVVGTGGDRLARRASTRDPLAQLDHVRRRASTARRLGLGALVRYCRLAASGWHRLGRPGREVARAALVAILVVLAATPAASASALRPLWRERGEIRPVALMVDATTQTRRLYRPGDVVVAGGRLARSGWLYAMDVSADGPFLASSAKQPGPVGPRVPTGATVFLTAVGKGEARAALAARRGPTPDRLLLFVLVYDRAGTAGELASLRAAGWCATQTFDYPGTGTLRVLARCS